MLYSMEKMEGSLPCFGAIDGVVKKGLRRASKGASDGFEKGLTAQVGLYMGC